MSKRPNLYIFRGLPGSGKTTTALQYFPHLMRVETDMYFSRRDKYIYTAQLNRKAVRWFNETVWDLAQTGMDFVVTGVFASHTERLDWVIQNGLDCGYNVYIVTKTADYGNIYNVPKKRLEAMRADFVPEDELKKIYKGNRRIHFGLPI